MTASHFSVSFKEAFKQAHDLIGDDIYKSDVALAKRCNQLARLLDGDRVAAALLIVAIDK